MVSDQKIKSTFWMGFFKLNVELENSPVLLGVILDITKQILSRDIPESQSGSICKDIFDQLYSYLQKSKSSEITEILSVHLINFLSDISHIKTASIWLREGCILDNEGDKIPGTELSQSSKYLIVKKIWDEPEISQKIKD